MDEKRLDTMARNLARLRHGAACSAGARHRIGLDGWTICHRRPARSPGRRTAMQEETGDNRRAAGRSPAGGVWEETIEMCHYDGNGMAASPASARLPFRSTEPGRHATYIDCCVSTDCTSTDCLTATGCVSGACAFDIPTNAPCNLGNGVYGICRSDGVCVPVSS